MEKPTQREQDKLLQRWIGALESGKYDQCTGTLRIGDSYCCLGVLCNMYDADNWVNHDNPELEKYAYGGPNAPVDLRGMDVLPSDIADILKINDTGGFRVSELSPQAQGFVKYLYCEDEEIDPKVSSLACMNDKGATFKQIARFVRNELSAMRTYREKELKKE